MLSSILAGKEGLLTDSTQHLLLMRAEAARIKAGLLTDPSLAITTLDVDFEGDRLVLRGVVRNARHHDRVERAAQDLAGELRLKCELRDRL